MCEEVHEQVYCRHCENKVGELVVWYRHCTDENCETLDETHEQIWNDNPCDECILRGEDDDYDNDDEDDEEDTEDEE
ncbi:hypothetical protein CF326_g3565 [Tilletia indica]|nr:hypothetical protein CF326_g3565 [Tilletia indica]